MSIKRIYVDRLTGGETAAQMRDLIIASLHGSKLFVMTENAERADAVMRGAAEDLVYTDSSRRRKASIFGRTSGRGLLPGGRGRGAIGARRGGQRIDRYSRA